MSSGIICGATLDRLDATIGALQAERDALRAEVESLAIQLGKEKTSVNELSLHSQDLASDLSEAVGLLQELSDFQTHYKKCTGDFAPGNEYWAEMLIGIVENARAFLARREVK